MMTLYKMLNFSTRYHSPIPMVMIMIAFSSLLHHMFFLVYVILGACSVVVATGASAPLPQGRPSVLRRPQPILNGIKKPNSFPINRIRHRQQQPAFPKIEKISGTSKYIWYSSHPFPPELQNRVIGKLLIPLPTTIQNNATTKTDSTLYYYFLSDLTETEVKKYSDFLAKNSVLSANWDHRQRISNPLTNNHGGIFQTWTAATSRMMNTEKAPEPTKFVSVAPMVNIYVLDSGVDVSLPEFLKNHPRSINYSDDKDGSDCDGHGTHIASLALGETYGIARYANLISIKVMGCNGNTNAQTIIQGIRHVLNEIQKSHQTSKENGEDIIPSIMNISIGGPENKAIDRILQVAGQQEGLYIFTSAGNDHEDACQDTFAKSTHTITVASTDKYNRRAYSSNYGPCVDVYAPGEDLLASVPYTVQKKGVARFSGTSMASPVAAGTLAVYLSKYGNTKGYNLFREQLLDGIVESNPAGTPNKFVHLNPDFL